MKDDFIKTKKILLVDDELELLLMEKLILTDDGYKNIETAVSVKAALSKLASYEPELLILDVMLPDGDGFSLMEQIRKKSDIPDLFLTARGEAEDRFHGLGIGVDDYIIKPFLPNKRVLQKEIDDCINTGLDDIRVFRMRDIILWIKENQECGLSRKDARYIWLLSFYKHQIDQYKSEFDKL